jgi:hypothetical protein
MKMIRRYTDLFAPARDYLVHVATDKNPTCRRAEFITIKNRRPRPDCEDTLTEGLGRVVYSLAHDHFLEDPASALVFVTLELAVPKRGAKRMIKSWPWTRCWNVKAPSCWNCELCFWA